MTKINLSQSMEDDSKGNCHHGKVFLLNNFGNLLQIHEAVDACSALGVMKIPGYDTPNTISISNVSFYKQTIYNGFWFIYWELFVDYFRFIDFDYWIFPNNLMHYVILVFTRLVIGVIIRHFIPPLSNWQVTFGECDFLVSRISQHNIIMPHGFFNNFISMHG